MYALDELLVGDKSPGKVSFQGLLNQAKDQVVSDYSGFAKLIASNLLTGCAVKSLCMQFDLSKKADASQNGSFTLGYSGWQSLINALNGRAYFNKVGVDAKALLQLVDNTSGASGFSSLEMFQELNVAAGTLDQYAASFILDSVEGGSSFAFGNPVGSGIAGAYVCFATSSASMGCFLAGYHNDIMQIPIKIGLAYSISSTQSFSYELLPNGSGARYASLKSLAENIPSVNSQLSSVTKVRVGLLVADTGASSTSFCNRCFAKVIASRVAIEQYKP